jgi:peptidoglycan/LPS O-acetylase OafA/YrhL
MQLPLKAGIVDSKIGALNGLRGIAIAMIVLFHLFIPYTARIPLRSGEIDGDGLFAAFINDLWLGVNIFFVLSGFVLYLPYRTGRRVMAGVAGFPAFYLHRAQRLLPLYYIVVLVTMALHSRELYGSRDWYLELGALLSTLFIFSAHGFEPPSNVVLWSVSVEIWFSVLFPVFVLLVQRWRTPNVVVCTVMVCAAFAYIGDSISIESVGYFRPFTSGILGSCYQFLLGMMVCDLYVKGIENPVLRGNHSQLLLPGAVITVGALYLMHHAAFIELRTLGNFGFAVGFAFVLLSILSGVNPLRRVLESWPLQVLGCMCYSVYAWHGIIMNEMIPASTSSLTDTLRLLAPFLFVTLALSGLSYRYIEFGRERNWKALFLVADADGASGPMPGHTVPVRGETMDGEALRLERPAQTENIPVTKTPDHEGSAQGTSGDTQLGPIASQTEKDSTLKKTAAT